ncbi:MAG: TonB-dependent receptor [Pseudomonadales bacterium]|nr:TonB-dependent receptor [Pseudomonadales bacterium]
MLYSFFIALLCALLSLSTATVNAADKVDLYSLSLEELMHIKIQTGSRFSEKLKDAGANITVIDQQQIALRAYRSLEDLLKDIPGVNIYNYSSFTAYNSISVHGDLGNNKVLILQDGVRISPAGGEFAAISHNYPLYYAKRVEVLLGPASIVYGADAFSMVVNIISAEDPQADESQIQLHAGEDGYYQATGIARYGLTNGLLQFGYQRFHSQDYAFAEHFPVYYPPDTVSPEGNDFNFSPEENQQLFIKYNVAETFEFGINHSDYQYASYYASKPDTSAFNTDNFEHIKQTSIYTRLNLDVTDKLSSSSLFSYGAYRLEDDSTISNIFSLGRQSEVFDTLYRFADTQRYNLFQDFKWDMGEAGNVVLGLHIDHIKSIPVTADLTKPYDTDKAFDKQNQFYQDTDRFSDDLALPVQFFENTQRSHAIFLQHNWAINKKHRVIYGLRYDDNSFYDDVTTPRASYIFSQNNGNVLKVIYGHAFLAPSPDFVYANYGKFNAFSFSGQWTATKTFHAPNETLKPEISRSLIVNYDMGINAFNRIKWVAYYKIVDDAILNTPDEEAQQFIPDALLFKTESYKNVGELTSYGFDISINNKYAFSAFNLESWFSWSSTFGHLEIDKSQQELPGITPQSFNLGLSLYQQEQWSFSAQLKLSGHANSLALKPEDNEARVNVSGFTVLDLHGSWAMWHKLHLLLDIYNLLDEKYAQPNFRSDIDSLPESPQPQRQFVAGLKLVF